MVDATTGHEALSFMDGSSGYNQIRMALEDAELTAFRTPKGIYCYKVMPFGLKNAGATYQARLSKAFNKKVLPRSFQMGDLILSLRRPIITTHKTRSKFTSKWDGPYVVQEVYTNGAYLIMAEDGLKIGPINGRFLKRYYP
ncbi:hypothetical protein FF1_000150 [Malus domestica]